jgi:hypothetical protein
MKILATEMFAQNHNLKGIDAFRYLKQNNLYDNISKHYNALHTQPLDEAYYFIEDVIKYHPERYKQPATFNV